MRADTIMMRRFDGIGSPALLPADTKAVEAISKLPKDELVGVRLVRDRSLPQHNLFFKVLDHVAKSSKWETPEKLLVALKIRLGRYDLMMLPNGKRVPVPQSISFGAMPQDEFQRFMDDAVQVICTEVLDGYDSERLIREAQGLVEA